MKLHYKMIYKMNNFDFKSAFAVLQNEKDMRECWHREC